MQKKINNSKKNELKLQHLKNTLNENPKNIRFNEREEFKIIINRK